MNVMSGGMGTMRTFKKILTTLILGLFASGQILPSVPAWSGTVSGLPIAGPAALLSPAAVAHYPAQMVGMTLRPENPLHLEFLIDAGQARPDDDAFGEESRRLIHYFMAALTVPEHDLWVNLSPHEKDRIMADGLSRTEMGRDLLEQDYLLKQLTASLLIPDSATGEDFWEQARAQWAATGSTEDMPTDLHSRVWIMPDSARVYLKDRTVLVTDARLKVMLEEDYLAAEVNRGRDNHGLGPAKESLRPLNAEQTRLVREMILPQIQREVNEGATFVRLRQIYHAMVLAVWYKNNLQSSVLNHAYAGRNRVQGIDPVDPGEKDQLHARYLKAFQDGLYGMVKDEYDPARMEIVSRRYVSGGFDAAQLVQTVAPGTEPNLSGRNIVTVDAAMATSPRVKEFVEDFTKRYRQQRGSGEASLLWAAEQIENFSHDLRQRGMSGSEIVSTRERTFDALLPERRKFLNEKIIEYKRSHPDADDAEAVQQILFDHSKMLGLTGKMLGLGDRFLTPVANYYEKYLGLAETKTMITLEELADSFKLVLDNDSENKKKVDHVIKLLNRLLGHADLPMIELTDKELTLENTREWFGMVDTIGAFNDELEEFFNSTNIQRPQISEFISHQEKKTGVSARAWEEHLKGILIPGENLESHFRKRWDEFKGTSALKTAPVQAPVRVPLEITHASKTYRVLKIAHEYIDNKILKRLVDHSDQHFDIFLERDFNGRLRANKQSINGVYVFRLAGKPTGRVYFRFFEEEGVFVLIAAEDIKEGHTKDGKNLTNSYKEFLERYDLHQANSFVDFVSLKGVQVEPVFKDPAMLSQEVGGIDLNPAALNLSVGGDAQLLDRAFADAAAELDFDPNLIQGIYPVIQMMTPAPPVPLLLGQAQK